jgi:hypothetical protein
MKKILVIGIILFFVGIVFQPVLSQETINTTLTDKEDDCCCNPVDIVGLGELQGELQSANRLLNRVKMVTSLVSILSKSNPEIKEKCEELSSSISFFEINNNEFNYNLIYMNIFICYILLILIENCYNICRYFSELMSYYEDYPIIREMARLLYLEFKFLMWKYVDLYDEYDCPPLFPNLE